VASERHGAWSRAILPAGIPAQYSSDFAGAMVNAVACPPRIDLCVAGGFYQVLRAASGHSSSARGDDGRLAARRAGRTRQAPTANYWRGGCPLKSARLVDQMPVVE
jgi:hypothetical protein